MPTERWQARWRTVRAAAMLARARLTIATLPFERWRKTLGGASLPPGNDQLTAKLAADVNWAARRVPFKTKCLPRAMALSWMMRKGGLGHTLVLAARPAGWRGTDDNLHAWIEVDGRIILGDLPGPWVETLRLK